MERAKKESVVAELDQIFSDAASVVVMHYAGITVAEMTVLRGQARDAGATIRVAKNRLAKIALEGKPGAGMAALLNGQTVLAYSDDPVAAPKVVSEFAKANKKLVILGGAMGDTLLDEAGVKALATMPSLDELRGRIIGLVQAPASKVARVLAAPATQTARVLAAYAEKDAA